jgi:hypothetical protein
MLVEYGTANDCRIAARVKTFEKNRNCQLLPDHCQLDCLLPPRHPSLEGGSGMALRLTLQQARFIQRPLESLAAHKNRR